MGRTARLGRAMLAASAAVLLWTSMLWPGAASAPAAPAPPGSSKPRSEKISSILEQILQGTASPPHAQGADQRGAQAVPSDVFVTVEAVAGQGPAASAAVTRAGGQVRTVYRELVDAVIPLAAIPTVAQDPSVLRIDLPLPPVATVVGQGVGLIGASRWQDGGLNGSGVRVGIVDLGFQGYALRLGGDLPGSVQTVCSPEALQNGQPHGTAVAEIVHSIAPAAELYLVNAQTTAEVGDAIACLASHGVSVINHSVGWAYAGPGDGHRAAIDAIVDDAVNRGILWVNSSGNQAQKHWAGLWSDPDGNGWLNFPDGGELLPVWLDAGHPLNAFLRWNDPWGGACNDYDLYLYDAAIVVRAGSENAQVCSPSSVPREALAYTASSSGWHYLAIRRHAASSLSRFDLITSNQDLPVIDQVAANSLLHPADSANPGMVSVGAVPWYSPAVLEPFSSQGPTTDGRIKPDLVAPDGVANAVFGAFAGTSAAAPHVAGAAALLKQANPDLSPAGLASLLRERIVDLGSLGPDSRFGTGRLSLGAPPSTSTPTPTSTASRTATATLTATQSATPMSTATATATALATPATTGTPTPTPSSTPSPTPATGGPAPTRTSGRGSSDHVRVFIPLAVR